MRGEGTVLVTGAAGFIGSHVAACLARRGLTVVGCDNFNDYYQPRLKYDRVDHLLKPFDIVCEKMELADSTQVADLFDKVKPSYVVHLAAQAGARNSQDNPAAYVQSNLVGFANILEACRHWRPQHMVYASSSSVYGESLNVPFHEDDATDKPVSLYAATKKSNEVLAYSYSHLFGLRITGLRLFTVYGPWGRPDMAYFSFTEKILREEEIPVFAEGKLSRDFTYIDDIVEGVIRVLMSPEKPVVESTPHTILNIGNHKPIKVIEFISTLESVLGKKARLQFLPMQPGDVPATYADTSRLQELVDFTPATSLEDGLERFKDWFLGWNMPNLIRIAAKPLN